MSWSTLGFKPGRKPGRNWPGDFQFYLFQVYINRLRHPCHGNCISSTMWPLKLIIVIGFTLADSRYDEAPEGSGGAATAPSLLATKKSRSTITSQLQGVENFSEISVTLTQDVGRNISAAKKTGSHQLPPLESPKRILQGLMQYSVGSVVPAAGSMIALHCAIHNRFLIMSDKDMGSEAKDVDKLPADWTWARFTVVDAGNGQIALHNAKWNRFVKMNGHDGDLLRSAALPASAYPSYWTWERFTVVDVGNGEVGLHNSLHNRYIRITDSTADASGTAGADGLPNGWTWERFKIVHLQPYLVPGSIVAFHCKTHNRFLRMNNNADMDISGTMDVDKFPGPWTWERFTVVDVGNGQVALHSPIWNRFVQLAHTGDAEASAERDANHLPSNWHGARFAVVPAGNDEFALHNPHYNRFLRMTDTTVIDSVSCDAGALPDGHIWERFKIVPLVKSTSNFAWAMW